MRSELSVYFVKSLSPLCLLLFSLENGLEAFDVDASFLRFLAAQQV